MTAKQAIKARCRVCTFTDCALKGLAKAKGKVSKKALLAYCRWCLNGHPFKTCSSPDCAIHQYRKEREKTDKAPGFTKKQGVQRGFLHTQIKKGIQVPLKPE